MWSIVARYTTLGEAEAAWSALDAAGIDCRIGDENMIAVDWMYSQAVGGVKLLVRDEDREEAAEVLASIAVEEGEFLPDADAVPPEDLHAPPPDASDAADAVCPRCHQPELHRVHYRRLAVVPLIAIPVMFLVLPVWLLLPKWKCDHCGRRAWFQ